MPEHQVGNLLASLDGRRASLSAVVPRFDEFRARPRQYLAKTPIEIGPASVWGMAFLLGFFVMILVGPVVTLPVSYLLGATGVKNEDARNAVLIPMLFVDYFLSVCLARWLTGGAKLVLREQGVEIHDGWSAVCCPWPLFWASGVEVVAQQSHVFLPIDARFVEQIEKRRWGKVVKRGAGVKNQHFRVFSNQQATMGDAFEVDIRELVGWLQALARDTSSPVAAAPPEMAESITTHAGSVVIHAGESSPAPASVPKPNRRGWVTVPVTQLVFPPLCCSCGSSTGSFREFDAHVGSIDLGRFIPLESSQFLRFQVPCCQNCERVRLERYRTVRNRGMLTGGLVGVLVTAGLTAWNQNIISLGIVFVILGIVIGRWLGHGFGSERHPPVRARRLSVEGGSVEVWFREPSFADAYFAQFVQH